MEMKTPGWLRKLGNSGAVSTDEEDERLRRIMMVYSSSMYAALATIWGAAYVLLGFSAQGCVPVAYVVISTGNLALFALGKRFGPYRFVQLLMFLGLPFVFQAAMGGFVAGSLIMIWAFAAPMVALMVSGRREATLWFAGFLALTVVSGALEGRLSSWGPAAPPVMRLVMLLMNVGGLAFTTFVLLHYFVVERQKARDRSELLLLNVLPRSIARRLKTEPGIIADEFPEVTVLFADVVGFTPRASQCSAEETVQLLNEVFSEFDRLADQYALEKIKTIGDAYMVVGGVPVPRPDHAEAVASMALDMLAVIKRKRPTWKDGEPLRVRAGMHTGGPVVAAVIGKRKFIYDVWGDAVNVASRMESQGVGDAIQVSSSVHARLRDRYQFELRGPVAVKGKGELITYFLTGGPSGADSLRPGSEGRG